jgi:cytochrome c-type biogenesis protein
VPDSLTLAVAAGMLAAVNPCGFALLPAYLSVLVLVISPVASQVQQYLPWFTVGFGLLVAAAGVWLLVGRELPRLRLGRGGGAAVTRTAPAMVGFGASYAAASLTCSIAPFLALVVAGFRAGSVGEGVVLYVGYAAGMGLLVGVAAVAVALARRGLVTGLRRSGRWVPRVTGVLLLVVGAYVAWYGAWELRVLGGDDPADPVIEVAARIQRTLADWVDAVAP